MGVSTAVASDINYSIFNKWFLLRCLGLAMGFEDHKVAPSHKKGLNLTKKGKNSPKTSLSALMGDPTAVTLATNHSLLHN